MPLETAGEAVTESVVCRNQAGTSVDTDEVSIAEHPLGALNGRAGPRPNDDQSGSAQPPPVAATAVGAASRSGLSARAPPRRRSRTSAAGLDEQLPTAVGDRRCREGRCGAAAGDEAAGADVERG